MKICIVVCHPDDEVLWALPIIEYFKPLHEVYILSLTHGDDMRGEEFKKVCSELKVNPLLSTLSDRGWSIPMDQIKQTLGKFHSQIKFDLILTHPPHGNERPHSHHVESFIECEDFSFSVNLSFGFFSEVPYITNGPFTSALFSLPSNPFKYCYTLYNGTKYSKFNYFYLLLLEIWRFKRKKISLECIPLASSLQKMHELLGNYTSELEGLKLYETYNKEERYLILYKYGN